MAWPSVLTVAGSDSGGGAGIQADLKTFSALGVYGMSAITALTAQNTVTVANVMAVPADFVAEQIDVVFSDIEVHAVKIGMLANADIVLAVADRLRAHGARNVVLDPVMVAKSGDALLSDDAIDALKAQLVPLASIMTPNIPEATRLAGLEMDASGDGMADLARRLAALGCGAVLVKGGHLNRDDSTDVLVTNGRISRFPGPRIETRNTHGTGCTLSSAIAANLARRMPLVEAVSAAKTYVTSAICRADALAIGHGHGPVHHFHAIWKEEEA